MPNSNVKPRTLKLAKMALMIAIAVICSFVQFPILPAAPHLRFELMDIPILIAGFAFGPIRGFVIAVVSILLRTVILMPDNSPHGQIMHIISIGVFVLVSCGIYHKWQSTKWREFTLILGYSNAEKRVLLEAPLVGLLSLVVGGLCMTAAVIPGNIIVTPLVLGLPLDVIYAMIVPVLIPFNLLKVAINTVVVFLIYKRLSPFLHKWE